MNRFSFSISRTLLFFTVLCCCIAVLNVPTMAADIHKTGYEICIKVTIAGSNGEFNDHPNEEYQEIAFVLQNSDLQYLLAEYNSDTGSYSVSGYVNDADLATRFQCSRNDSTSGKLLITGLDAGNYTLTNVQVNTGYVVLKDSIIVVISDTTASVNGYVLEKFDGTRVNFSVNLTKGFEFPMSKPYDREMRLLGLILLPISISALILTQFSNKKSKESYKTD